MTTTRSICVAVGALAVLAAATPARAISVDQYLKLRRLEKTDRALAYSQVAAQPAPHLQKVIELRGTVNGSITRDTGLSFLLSLDDGAAVMLDAPGADRQIVATVTSQRVRVLARVCAPQNGNIVPLDVLGIALDAEVTVREEEALRKEEAAAARRKAEEEAQQARSTSSRPAYATRNGYAGQSRMPFAAGEVSALARRYLGPEAQAIYPAYKAYISRCNRRLSETQLDAITTSLLYFAVEHRVDPRLVVAVFIAESDFDPRCTSHKGAMGIGQIMPDEARRMRVKDPYDPIDNVRASIGLLKEKLNRYNEGTPDGVLTLRQVQLALAAYNAGPGAVKKYGGVPPYRETQGYIKKILKRYAELCSGA